MVEQANELILDILPLSAQTARLVRVYGTAPCVALPGTLPAPEGGSLALTELGDSCFAEKPRSLPAAETGRSCWGSVLIFQSPAKGLRKNQQTQPVRPRAAP